MRNSQLTPLQGINPPDMIHFEAGKIKEIKYPAVGTEATYAVNVLHFEIVKQIR